VTERKLKKKNLSKVMISYLKLLVLVIALIISEHQSLSLRIKGKKTVNNLNSWTLEWFKKNKFELISLNDQQLKFKLNQELAKYSKINQNIFNEILSKILNYQKKIRQLEKSILQDSLYSLRF
jgi:hypothetical protein